MDAKNKKFRNHCDIEVHLDKKEGSLSVSVTYKPKMFSRPLSRERHRYCINDVKYELERQGIDVADSKYSVQPTWGVMDNTSTIVSSRSLQATFELAEQKSSKKTTAKASKAKEKAPAVSKSNK
tara:strand:- start:647 stop:1018 length:372 start_codon:yes stop_codon:yes gene_type:complete